MDFIRFSCLCLVVLDKRYLNDMPQLADPYHTGNIEVFHSLLNHYAPKINEFDLHVMDARVKLAAMSGFKEMESAMRF